VRHPTIAFLLSVPIAALGGLIGLGGAEFRLPVLVGVLGHSARQAVPLNLAVSLVTIITGLATRAAIGSGTDLTRLALPMAALIAGALVTAFVGPALAGRLSETRLTRLILVLLVLIGLALIAESFLPAAIGPLIPTDAIAQLVAGVVLGLGIGLISSLLGVAGGEVIIPTLAFGYGAPIKLAGTASLLVSLPVVAVGIARYWRRGGYERHSLVSTAAPMAAGSVVGAVLGGLLVGIVPSEVLKLTLGVILIGSAARVFRH